MALRLDRTRWPLLAGHVAISFAVGVLAGLDPQLAIAVAVACGFFLLVFADLAAGLAAFGFFSFLELMDLGTVISVGKLGGLLLAVAWIAVLATKEDAHNDFTEQHPMVAAALGLFLGWALLSTVWAEDPRASLGAAGRYGLNVVLFLIVFTAVRRKDQAYLVTGALVAGAAAATIYGLIVGSDTIYGTRLSGTNLDPNELASVLVAGVALGFALAAGLRSPGLRLAGLAGGLCCLLGIFLTVSRGGILALGVMVLAALVLAGRWRLRAGIAAAVVVSVSVLYFAAFAPDEARERIATSTQGQTRVLEGRTTIWQIGWRMVKANPAVGVGAGNFPVASKHYLLEPGAVTASNTILIVEPQVAHNTFLGVLAELGAVGLTLFLVVIFFCLACCLQAAARFRARGDPSGEILARGFAIGLIGTLTADFFITQEFSKQLWLMLGMAPALLSIAVRAETGD